MPWTVLCHDALTTVCGRVAFAFDPNRQAVLLVAGDKSGGRQTRFYRQLIRTADTRFDEYLKALKKEKKR